MILTRFNECLFGQKAIMRFAFHAGGPHDLPCPFAFAWSVSTQRASCVLYTPMGRQVKATGHSFARRMKLGAHVKVQEARQTARRAASSRVVVVLARLGYAVKGVVYVVI